MCIVFFFLISNELNFLLFQVLFQRPERHSNHRRGHQQNIRGRSSTGVLLRGLQFEYQRLHADVPPDWQGEKCECYYQGGISHTYQGKTRAQAITKEEFPIHIKVKPGTHSTKNFPASHGILPEKEKVGWTKKIVWTVRYERVLRGDECVNSEVPSIYK